MALCVQVCCSLNGSERTRRQEWLLSSSQRPLQTISPKAEFMEVWSGTGNPALAPQTLWVPAHMLLGQQSAAWLPGCVFLSPDLLRLLLLLLQLGSPTQRCEGNVIWFHSTVFGKCPRKCAKVFRMTFSSAPVIVAAVLVTVFKNKATSGL